MVTIAGVGVGRRTHSAYARSRLTEACYEVACETVFPSSIERASRDEREWLRDALAAPVAAAVASALDVLGARLEDALADAPPELLDRLEGIQPRPRGVIR